MEKERLRCLDCEISIKKVSLSDLIGEKSFEGSRLIVPNINAVFDYFDFWACPKCGRTLIYAGPDARKEAAS